MSTFEHTPRSSWQVTKSVWHALFMREVLGRTTGDRFAVFWMIVEPIAYIVLFVGVRSILGKLNFIAGAEFVPWMIVGLMTFFVFREGMQRSLGAIGANQSLFTYRQVKPFDAVLARNVVDFLLRSFIFILVLCGASLIGYKIMPGDPLGAIFIWLLAWMLGFGVGLIISVCGTLVPEIGRLVKMFSFPLMLLSGVLFPVNFLPHIAQEYIVYNPVLIAIESIRLCFFEGYYTLNNISFLVLLIWVMASLGLGLALHVKFGSRLKAK